MAPENSKKTSTAVRIAAAAAAVVIIAAFSAWMIISGRLGEIGRIGDEQRIDRSEETFESGEEGGGEYVRASDVDLNADDIVLLTGENVKNILLIGTDEKTGEEMVSRSDTMIICSIDSRSKEIRLISLMRDTYVTIPGFSDNRLNASYAFGGITLLDETIEKNLGVHIDGNLLVDYEAFVASLAAVGDLEIMLSADEVTYLISDPEYGNATWDLEEGMNMLTPEQALAYARMRRVGRGDFDRTERQRRVMTAAFNKVRALPLIRQLSIANSMLPHISTDMPNSTILVYALQLAAGRYSLGESLRIPVDGAWRYAMIDGYMSVILPDLQKNSKALQEFIYGTGAAQN